VFASRYDVQSRVGSGASATVYRAVDLEANRVVALKISRPYVLTKHRRAARFLREVQAVQRIDHDGIVRIFDWGIEHDCAYIAMELIAGDDLYDIVKSEAPMEEHRAVLIAARICDALAAAHPLGVIHRDLKPRNVMVLEGQANGAQNGATRVKLLDFGLAKLMRTPADDEGTLPLELTKPGAVLGTPHYMAPEQVRSEGDVDGRADLYAVSVMLYEMVTARRPVEERNAVRALIALGSARPKPPREHVADIDPDLEGIIMRGLAKAPSDRFPSADQMAGDLHELAERLRAELEPTLYYKSAHRRSESSDDMEAPTRMKTPAVEAAVPASVDSDEEEDSEDDVLTRVQRPQQQERPQREERSEDDLELPTRVYKPGEGPQAPKMRAKRKRSDERKPAVTESDILPTRVMRRKRDAPAPPVAVPEPPAEPRAARERSETEKGVRAALLTLTVVAIVAALGRWLDLW
jgi:serine/threonine protein kinase